MIDRGSAAWGHVEELPPNEPNLAYCISRTISTCMKNILNIAPINVKGIYVIYYELRLRAEVCIIFHSSYTNPYKYVFLIYFPL